MTAKFLWRLCKPTVYICETSSSSTEMAGVPCPDVSAEWMLQTKLLPGYTQFQEQWRGNNRIFRKMLYMPRLFVSRGHVTQLKTLVTAVRYNCFQFKTTYESEKREAKIMAIFFPSKDLFCINFLLQRKTNYVNLFAQTTHLASKLLNWKIILFTKLEIPVRKQDWNIFGYIKWHDENTMFKI